jgi:hypothetical protein
VYEPVSADSFVLGATFARPDSIAPTGTGVSPFWSHGAGPARFGFGHHAADEGKAAKPR